MADNHIIKDPREFTLDLEKYNASEPGRYDTFNPRANTLINNDAWLDENKSSDPHGNEAHEPNFAEHDIREHGTKPLVLERRTNDPSSPDEGRIWLRTDL